MNTKEELLKARSLLILDHPFFGCLALKLQLIKDSEVKTARVNPKTIRYNPNWIDTLTPQQIKGVMAHEVLHIAMGHNWRQGSREYDQWQMAADYSINHICDEAGLTLPDGALRNQFYNNLSVEEIYAKLEEQKQQKQQQQKQNQNNKDKDKDKSKGQGKEDKNKNKDEDEDEGGKSKSKEQSQPTSDPGGCGAVEKTEDKEEAEETKAEWKAAVAQALQVSQGNIPAELKRQIQEVLDPPLPWYILLRDFVERTARNDYSWSRPSRRYFSRGIILPSLISEELPEVIIAIDTSGSISEEQLSHFATEVSAVFEAYDTKLRIMYCDSKVQKEEEYTRQDLPLDLKPIGGGGTDFTPVFEQIDKKGYTPACLIYFTDMYGRFPAQIPEYPVMWISTTLEETAPFGITIYFRKEK